MDADESVKKITSEFDIGKSRLLLVTGKVKVNKNDGRLNSVLAKQAEVTSNLEKQYKRYYPLFKLYFKVCINLIRFLNSLTETLH